MTRLLAICGVCGAAVDAETVGAHMDSHGLLLPSDWQLVTWPDGVTVLIDPEEEAP